MTGERSIFEQFELRGYWWLPEKPQRKVAGNLRFDPHEPILLKLMGCFADDPDEESGIVSLPRSPVRRPLILGTTDNGEYCTLFGTLERPRFSGTLESWQLYADIYINSLFLGCHFAREADVVFKSVQIELTQLDEWLGVDPLGQSFDPFVKASEAEAPLNLPIPYCSRKLFETHVPTRDVSISLYSEVSFEARPQRSLNLLHKVFFILDPESPHDYAWHLELLQLLRQFVAFVVGGPTHVIAMKAGSKSNRTVEIYQPPWQHGNEGKSARACLPYGAIQRQVPRALRAWIENAEKFRAVYDFAVTNYYDERMDLKAEFLNLAQALEIFHRCRFGKKYGLNQRLKQLFDELSAPAKAAIAQNPGRLIETVEQTRDCLVHHDDHRKQSVLRDSKGFLDANRRLRALLFVQLCKMLGIDERVAATCSFGFGESTIW